MAEMEKTTEDHVEAVDGDLSKQKDPAAEVEVMGTVKLTEDTIVYIPTPTADPRGMSMCDGQLVDTLANMKSRSVEHVHLAENHHSDCGFYL